MIQTSVTWHKKPSLVSGELKYESNQRFYVGHLWALYDIESIRLIQQWVIDMQIDATIDRWRGARFEREEDRTLFLLRWAQK